MSVLERTRRAGFHVSSYRLQVVYHLQKDERKHAIQTKPEIHVSKATPQNRPCLKSGQNNIPCIQDVFQTGSTLVLMICLR